jgi:hypothetical protein
MDILLHVTLQKPPAGVDYALQKGSGSKFDIVQVQRSAGEDLYFNLAIEIRGDRQKDNLPKFRGPFVQGSSDKQFFYIGIGAFAGQAGTWSRRLKIPLTGISWQMIDQINGNPGSRLETWVPGTAKDGSPNCATVKPFDGWEVKMPAS